MGDSNDVITYDDVVNLKALMEEQPLPEPSFHIVVCPICDGAAWWNLDTGLVTCDICDSEFYVTHEETESVGD